LITIVIPTYNRLEYLIKAYKSVLEQDSNDYILHIVDDSTNDDTYNYFKKIKLKNNIIYEKNEKNLGIVENISKVLKIAKTKWVTILSDDDILEKDFISTSLKTLTNSDKAIVIASFKDIDESGNFLAEHKHRKVSYTNVDAFVELFYDNFPTAGISGIFFDTHLCKDIFSLKDYPDALLSDSYLCRAAAKIGGMETIDKVIYNRRRWSGSLSSGGRSIIQMIKTIYASHRAHKIFRIDMMDMWKQLMVEHENSEKLIAMKDDLYAYYQENVIMNSIMINLKKIF